jgi:L-alanine-DL-glutamate epimerase-like enolase superfamily enzyme
VKIKIGESWGTAIDRDLARIEVAGDAIGEDTALFVDANGAFSLGQARRLLSSLRDVVRGTGVQR